MSLWLLVCPAEDTKNPSSNRKTTPNPINLTFYFFVTGKVSHLDAMLKENKSLISHAHVEQIMHSYLRLRPTLEISFPHREEVMQIPKCLEIWIIHHQVLILCQSNLFSKESFTLQEPPPPFTLRVEAKYS